MNVHVERRKNESKGNGRRQRNNADEPKRLPVSPEKRRTVLHAKRRNSAEGSMKLGFKPKGLLGLPMRKPCGFVDRGRKPSALGASLESRRKHVPGKSASVLKGLGSKWRRSEEGRLLPLRLRDLPLSQHERRKCDVRDNLRRRPDAPERHRRPLKGKLGWPPRLLEGLRLRRKKLKDS